MENLDRYNTAQDLGQLVGEIVKSLNRQFKKQFHEFAGGQALTVPQILLLHQLVVNGSSTISELAEHLNLANSTISGIVDRLERDGFVYRLKDEVDRRIVHVHLTEHAKRLRQQVPEFQKKFLLELMQGTSDQNLHEMLVSFTKFYKLIQRFEDKEESQTITDTR